MTQDAPYEVLSAYVRIRGIERALCGDTRTACSSCVKAEAGLGGEMLRGRESEHGKFWGRQEDLLGVRIESAARRFEQRSRGESDGEGNRVQKLKLE
jgi:hypothetical protein